MALSLLSLSISIFSSIHALPCLGLLTAVDQKPLPLASKPQRGISITCGVPESICNDDLGRIINHLPPMDVGSSILATHYRLVACLCMHPGY
ncbi:hypothetical protein V8C40DRAFT_83712 [Trichoderma camerunense]